MVFCVITLACADFVPPVLAVYMQVKEANVLGYNKTGFMPKILRFCKVKAVRKAKPVKTAMRTAMQTASVCRLKLIVRS